MEHTTSSALEINSKRTMEQSSADLDDQPKRWVSFHIYSPKAIAPAKSSSTTASYKLFSAVDVVIDGKGFGSVTTDIGLTMPNYLAGLMVGTKELFKQGLIIQSTIVSPDYDGRIKVDIHNISKEPVEIIKGTAMVDIMFVRILNQRNIYPKNTIFKKRRLE